MIIGKLSLAKPLDIIVFHGKPYFASVRIEDGRQLVYSRNNASVCNLYPDETVAIYQRGIDWDAEWVFMTNNIVNTVSLFGYAIKDIPDYIPCIQKQIDGTDHILFDADELETYIYDNWDSEMAKQLLYVTMLGKHFILAKELK